MFRIKIKPAGKFPLCYHSIAALLKSRDGYALPSVIFLLALLATIGLTVLSYSHLSRNLAFSQVNQIQAEYAAQSGIVRLIAVDGLGLPENDYSFPDRSTAEVASHPWGLLEYVFSQGKSHRYQTTRVALVAGQPSRDFSHALKFCNPQHQLVLTGFATIRGNVVVGKPGITTGNLRDFPTPRALPIDGNVTREESPSLPTPNRNLVRQKLKYLDDIMNGGGNFAGNHLNGSNSAVFLHGEVDLGSISENVGLVRIDGDASVTGFVHRRFKPVYIITSRPLTIASGTDVRGLVAFVSSQQVTVSHSVKARHIVVYSRSAIEVESGSSISGQLIAPRIAIKPQASLEYPSFVVSFSPNESKESKQGITLGSGSRVEGMVFLDSEINTDVRENLIHIESGATVMGAVYSSGSINLEGNVYGSVFTREFYFYQAPTEYFGWLRAGTINRSLRPEGFLVPIGFSSQAKLDVLDWL